MLQYESTSSQSGDLGSIKPSHLLSSCSASLRAAPSKSARDAERCYGAGDEEVATSSLHLTDGGAAMPQPNDLSRSLVALDQNSTIIAVVEVIQSSWLVGGVVPGY